jgi:hypothetical protein
MRKIRLTERNLQQLVRRVIQETQVLNEGKTCGCGVGEGGDFCTVVVSGGAHDGIWDCACCCCILDDAGSIKPRGAEMDAGFTMGEGYGRRRRSYRRR